jgi:dihydropyrimidinase
MTRRAQLVVIGGTVVNATGSRPATVVVTDGRVSAFLDPAAPLPAHDRLIDATSQLVLPGGVDPHCHVGQRLGEVSMLDDYAQSSIAALWGGTTTIIDFAIPQPGESPLQAVHARRRLAEWARCDTALHGGVVAWDATTRDQLDAMAELGVLTTKLFTTYRGGVMADPDTIRQVMQVNERHGSVTLIHAEHNSAIEDAQQQAAANGQRHARWHALARPEHAEVAAVDRILAMAGELRAAVYFVHQTTPEAVDRVTQAHERGIRAYSETCPHYLLLDDSVYTQPAPERFVCCPPLRPAGTVRGLRDRVLAGACDTIGSDHCCYSTGQKSPYADDAVYVPNGLPGVETRRWRTSSRWCPPTPPGSMGCALRASLRREPTPTSSSSILNTPGR